MSRLFSDRWRGRPLRVFIHGHYNSGNVGDEALLWSLLLALSEWLPGEDVEVRFVSRQQHAPPHVPGVHYQVLPDQLGAELCAARWADLLIFGGGSQFQDFGMPGRVRFLLKPLLLACVAHRVAGVGLSLGPVQTRLGLLLTRWTLKRMVTVHVRDRVSVAFAASLGVEAVAGQDLVVGLPAWQTPETRAGAGACRMLLSLVPFTAQGASKEEEAVMLGTLRAALQRLQREHPDLQLRGADFEPGRDTAPLISVLEGLAALPLLTGDVQGVRDGFLTADLVLATRLHSMVFAFLAGRPTLVIDYHPKVRALAERLGYPEGVILTLDLLSQPEALYARLSAFFLYPERHLSSRTPGELRVQAGRALTVSLNALIGRVPADQPDRPVPSSPS